MTRARPWVGPVVALALASLGLATLVLGAGACADEPAAAGAGVVTDITLNGIQPVTLIPGSRLVLLGGSFVPDFAGSTKLVIDGTYGPDSVHVELTGVTFDDFDRMHVEWPGAIAAGLSSETGTLSGQAYVESQSRLDGATHRSPPAAIELDLRSTLTPSLSSVQNEVLFVNDPIVLHGEQLLLGMPEGRTLAEVEGCFTSEGGSECVPVGPTRIEARPFQPFDRTRAVFPFAPEIAGIKPGRFVGTVRVINEHGALAGGESEATEPRNTSHDMVETTIASLSPAEASLGQYVDIEGGGFVGVAAGQSNPNGAVTTIDLLGTFLPDGLSEAIPAQLSLVPEFVSGQLVRYVLNEEDELGQSIDLRTAVGQFTGTATPVVQYAADTVQGAPANVSFRIARVKQVIHIQFLPSYVESLRHFGLRAVDARVRDRVFEVIRRDYDGINLDARAQAPADFALYSVLEIGGPDPNGIGLLGYDNTVGKDDGNLRLHDRIGGVNALTQEDGYPGYGGVFVESLFAFSDHPGSFAERVEGADPAFDQLFDPFRPDLGAVAVSVEEVTTGAIEALSSGDACPAGDRPRQIGCAIWALGSLIGTTVSHEIAHSLGLADPGGPAFHNATDSPDAIMDAGQARSFRERAEVFGEGPGRFCQVDFAYLQQILPTGEPDPLPDRQDCF